MTEIGYEDFEGTSGVTLPQSPTTIFDVVSGGGTSTYDSAVKWAGNTSGKVVCAAGAIRILDFQFTAETLLWSVFYYQYAAAPSATTTVVAAYEDTAPEDSVAQLRLDTAGGLRMRDQFTLESWAGVTLTEGVTYRVAWKVDTAGNVHRCIVYEGDSLTPLGDSGDVALTLSGKTSVNSLRLGVIQAGGALTQWFDELHVDDATEWTPEEPPPAFTTEVTYGRHIVLGG